MDSLTQIVLGAAVGEIALGKKIGNRALIWGAIGGTIPDLDVIANSFMDPIESLAFHRGITHSIFFSVVGGALFGWLVHRLYLSSFFASKGYKAFISIINALIILGAAWGINTFFNDGFIINPWIAIPSVLLGGYLMWRLYVYYYRQTSTILPTSFREWYWLFFLAFFTHIVLDCFTAFGTQVFIPFSNYRVAFDNISVADPAYTIPFLTCVIITACLRRGSRARSIANWTGIIISSGYMLLTIINKVHVDGIFEKALHHRNIDALRCRTSPTILNNILWTCVAEDNDRYYIGQYSLFDSNPNLHLLNEFVKNDSIHNLLKAEEEYQTLEWFSDGYLMAFPTDTAIFLTDLRFGGMGDTLRGPDDFVFKFVVKKETDGFSFEEAREQPPGEFKDLLRKFIERIKGY